MIKFKKVFSIKVLSVIVAATFFLGSIAFGIDLSNKAHLRTSSMGDSQKGRNRLKEGLDATLNLDRVVAEKEIQKILQENIKYFVFGYDSITGLPYNYIDVDRNGAITKRKSTWISPTDIGLYLNVLIAVVKGDIVASDSMNPDEAMKRLQLLMQTLRSIKKSNGFFYYYDLKNGGAVVSDLYGRLISTIDNGNLAASLAVLVGAFQDGTDEQKILAEMTKKMLTAMEWNELYDIDRELLIGGYYTDENGQIKTRLAWCIDRSYNEGRIAAVMALLSEKVPLTTWSMLKTVYGSYNLPDGTTVGVVKTWNGSAFQAWLPLLFFDELKWSPKGYARAYNNFFAIQVNESVKSGLNGALLSSCYNPNGEYRENGIPVLAESENKIDLDVGTPHATALVSLVNRHASLILFKLLDRKWPDLKGPFGYYESVDLEGRISTRITTLAQGMLILSFAGKNSQYMQAYLETIKKLALIQKRYEERIFTIDEISFMKSIYDVYGALKKVRDQI